MFEARLVLAATLCSNYGIYGPAFELGEHVPRESGSEEYLDSEKYQQRTWDLDAPTSLAPLITRVNAIRRAHPALQRNDWLRFHELDNDQLVAYSKRASSGDDAVLAIVSLDPRRAQVGRLTLALEEFGLPPDRAFEGRELLSGRTERWAAGGERDVRIDPDRIAAEIWEFRA
jgi:starch synthase (maltosyl-transferring)